MIIKCCENTHGKAETLDFLFELRAERLQKDLFWFTYQKNYL